MVHCQYFPISGEDLANGIGSRCSYVKFTVTSKGRRAKLVENSELANLIAPRSQSVMFLDEPGIYTTDDVLCSDDAACSEGEFFLPTVHQVTGTYDRGATFSFSVSSDADEYYPGTRVALAGCESHITIEKPVFNEERKFVSGVSTPLLQAIIDTCGGLEY